MANNTHRNEEKKKGKSGKVITAALFSAAALAGAALLYLKKKGLDPKKSADKVGKSARIAGRVLKGESRAAYNEVREIIIEELRDSDKEVNKKRVQTVINDILKILQRRGTMTKAGLAALGQDLKEDWESIQKEARK